MMPDTDYTANEQFIKHADHLTLYHKALKRRESARHGYMCRAARNLKKTYRAVVSHYRSSHIIAVYRALHKKYITRIRYPVDTYTSTHLGDIAHLWLDSSGRVWF